MRIKSQFLAVIAGAATLAALAAIVVTLAARRENTAGDAQRRAQLTAHEVAGLLTLAQEYARNAEPRAAEQWHQRHRAIAAILVDDGTKGLDSSAHAELRQVAGALPAQFSRLETLPVATDAFTERRKAVLVDQLLASTQAMSDYAYQWSLDAAAVQDEAERAYRAIVFGALLAMMLMLAALAALVHRRVLRPMAGLERAAAALRDGDLAHRLASRARDEFGDLARQFDAMAEALADGRSRLQRSEQQLRAVADNLPALVAYVDAERRYGFANAKHQEWLGLAPQQIVGRTVAEVLGTRVDATGYDNLERALGGERFQWEGRLRLGGRDAHHLAEYIPDVAPDGTVRGCFVLSIDITARREAELRLAGSEQRLVALMDHIPAMVGYFDMHERCQYANDTGLKSLGLARHDLPSLSLRAALGDANYAQHEPYVREVLQGRRARFDGKTPFVDRPAHYQAHLIPDRVDGGEQRGFYLMTFDITAMKEAQLRQAEVERQLSALVRADTLTGLPNRFQFNEALPMAMARARRAGAPMALMYLDIDHFKSINDSLGHAAGDAVLCEFAARLRRSVRMTDTVARLSGDEFVITLEGLHSEAETQAIALKLIAQVNLPFVVGGRSLVMKTSIGIAFCGAADADETPEHLLQRADEALYLAKASGRNTYRLTTGFASLEA